jgi:hypothetical protein
VPRKKTPEELARTGRSPGRDSAGRVIGAERGNAMCSHAARRIAKAKPILDPATFDIYVEAVDRIERETPHYNGYHGMPDPEALDDIAIVENAINPILPAGLRFRTSRLFGLMGESSERSAD